MADEPINENEKEESVVEENSDKKVEKPAGDRVSSGQRPSGPRQSSGPRQGSGGPRQGGGGRQRYQQSDRSDRNDRNDRNDRSPGGFRRGGGRFQPRRKVCNFCVDKVKSIDWKDVDGLRRYINGNGSIRARRKTGTCAKHQRQLAVAIKRVRHLALTPFTDEHARFMNKG